MYVTNGLAAVQLFMSESVLINGQPDSIAQSWLPGDSHIPSFHSTARYLFSGSGCQQTGLFVLARFPFIRNNSLHCSQLEFFYLKKKNNQAIIKSVVYG